MELILKRIALNSNYTIGKLFLNNVYFCDTLEDKVRDLNKDGDLEDVGEEKVYGESAIPYGTYKITLRRSPHFKRILPWLHDVKGFEYILIHAGNTPKDTLGCILVGENKVKGKILNSRKYEDKLVKILLQLDEKELITIKII